MLVTDDDEMLSSNAELEMVKKDVKIALLENNKEISQDLDRTIDRHMTHVTKLITSLTQPLSDQTMKLAIAQDALKKEIANIKSDIKIHKKTLVAYAGAGVIAIGVIEFFIKMIIDTRGH